MKKIISTLIAITVIALGSVNIAAAEVTTLANIGTFNKIEVHGNVEVIISNGEKNKVQVNNNYYAESAMLQGEDGVLRISSYKAQKLVVYVTANDLQAIAAYDNAVVKSDGKLSLIALEVNLYNNAYAGLNLDNYAASITVNDQAKADLSGSAVEYNLTYSQSSTVNRAELIADKTNETMTVPRSTPKHKHSIAE